MKIKSLSIWMAVVLLAGCTSVNATTSETDRTMELNTSTSHEISEWIQVNSEDTDESFDASTAIAVNLSDLTTVKATGVTVGTDTVTITRAGVYHLTGSYTGSIQINSTSNGIVRLVLDNVNITTDQAQAILVSEAEKVVITSLAGTSNTLQSSGSADSENATIYSHDDLSINGTGELIVISETADGINGRDDVILSGTNLKITAGDDGVVGKDTLALVDNTMEITSTGDGLKASNDSDADSGILLMDGGSYQISAGDDGLDGISEVVILDGELNVVSGDGHENSEEHTSSEMGFGNRGGFDGMMMERPTDGTEPEMGEMTHGGKWFAEGEEPEMPSDFEEGEMPSDFEKPQMPSDESVPSDYPEEEIESETEESSTDVYDADSSKASKGITAVGSVKIFGGNLTFDTADDGISADTDIWIEAGTIAIAAGDDGIHADGILTIAGGTINVTTSYEGLEGTEIHIQDGLIDVYATDDGINSSNSATTGDGMGGDGSLLNITGGTIHVTADGDGLDMNGSGTMSGGTVTVDGPENSGNGALDYATAFEVTGGTLYAGGASGMAQSPSSSSTQNSISVGTNGGSVITLQNAAGETILTYTSERSFQNVIFSSELIVTGETYTAWDGETELGSVMIESSVSYLNSSTMGNGGMMGGGMKGNWGDRGETTTNPVDPETTPAAS